MANVLTAGNSSNGGTAISTDTSGTLNIVTGSGSGVTAITVDGSQNVTVAGNMTASGTLAVTSNQTIGGNLTVTGTITGGSISASNSVRAWVNFNGTGTVAIRGSGNVTSITDNGTGDYTVNFTTAMTDANYAAAALANDNTAGTNLIIACENQSRTKSASQYHLYTAYGGNGVNKALYDVNTVNVAIIR